MKEQEGFCMLDQGVKILFQKRGRILRVETQRSNDWTKLL